MKVLHLIAPVRFGGGESLLVNLTAERRADLVESVVCVYDSPDFTTALKRNAVPCLSLTSATLGAGVSRRRLLLDTWRWPALAFRLVRLLRRERPDVVHVHGFPAIGLWGILRKSWPVPAVYTHHFVRERPSTLEQRLLGSFYRACMARTGVSDVVSRSMLAAFPEAGAFVTIPNCVGNQFFDAQPSPDTLALRPGAGVVALQPARFSRFKNQYRVVEALATLDPVERAGLTVWFAGDGPERQRVEQLASELGVSDRLRFLGHVGYDRMPAMVAAADFGLFPSETEGFGIGAVECQAVGKPVLACDNALMREVLGDGAVLVPPSQLADGLVTMMGHAARLSAAARASAARFRPAVVKDAYLALYGGATMKAR